MSSNNPFVVRATITKSPGGIEQTIDLKLSDLVWRGSGDIGPVGLTDRARDLLEIARVVWEIEKRTPKRVSSHRVREIEVSMSLRDVAAWDEESLGKLRQILRLLGNAEWTFTFRKRPKKAPTSLDNLARSMPVISAAPLAPAVALFSGGLDSTSGLAWLAIHNKEAALASFYGAKEKQTGIRKRLNFKTHFQMQCRWAGDGRRFGGQFQYRSLLFLSLGAAVASSFKARTLYQFENGPLACALPPSAMYRMTRHAHPKLHVTVSALLSTIFKHPMTVSNPFLTMTKREALTFLQRHCKNGTDFASIVAATETCWNLNSRYALGRVKKANGQPCGLCIPCLVRRTAIPVDPIRHAVDFGDQRNRYFRNETARIHVDAFLGWAQRFRTGLTLEQFVYELPHVVREALLDTHDRLTPGALYALYKRFADEILNTFPMPS